MISKKVDAMDKMISAVHSTVVVGPRDLGIKWPLKSVEDVDEVKRKVEDPLFRVRLVKIYFKL